VTAGSESKVDGDEAEGEAGAASDATTEAASMFVAFLLTFGLMICSNVHFLFSCGASSFFSSGSNSARSCASRSEYNRVFDAFSGPGGEADESRARSTSDEFGQKVMGEDVAVERAVRRSSIVVDSPPLSLGRVPSLLWFFLGGTAYFEQGLRTLYAPPGP
jgi:hypothetical protein